MHEHMKDFAYRYNQLTLPFRLRKTMHHELQAVTFRGGEIATSKRFTLHSEKEIREYIDARQYSNTERVGTVVRIVVSVTSGGGKPNRYPSESGYR